MKWKPEFLRESEILEENIFYMFVLYWVEIRGRINRIEIVTEIETVNRNRPCQSL